MFGSVHVYQRCKENPLKKRVCFIILFFIMLPGFASCTEKKDDKALKNGEIVIYSLRKDGFLEATVPLFEEKYGIKCRVFEEENVAGEGLIKGDVIVGVTEDFIYSNQEKLLTYISVNDKYLMERYRNKEGFSTAYMLDGSCLIANRSLVEKNEMNGYKDLLKSKYRGQIVVGNPLTSAAAFSHLTSMLCAMGGAESEVAWEYLDELFSQVGETVSDSTKMYDDVATGRMMIGLASEAPAISMINSGAEFFVIYPEEGMSYQAVRACIVKSTKNEEYAKHFVDFISGREMQNIYAEKLLKRVVYEGITGSENLVPMEQIRVNEEDVEYIKKNRLNIIQKYSDKIETGDN